MSNELTLPHIRESVDFPVISVAGKIVEVGGDYPDCEIIIDIGYSRFSVPVSMQMAIDFAKHLYKNVRITVELVS